MWVLDAAVKRGSKTAAHRCDKINRELCGIRFFTRQQLLRICEGTNGDTHPSMLQQFTAAYGLLVGEEVGRLELRKREGP